MAASNAQLQLVLPRPLDEAEAEHPPSPPGSLRAMPGGKASPSPRWPDAIDPAELLKWGVRRGARASPPSGAFSLHNLQGRLTELSAKGATSALTMAFQLILEAQEEGESCAWVSFGPSTFFAPDAAEGGVDLSALPVVRAQTLRQALRAADHLARSGAFGLLVLDLGRATELPAAILTRLTGQAAHHRAAVVLLTSKDQNSPSMSSLVSLRGQVERTRLGPGRFACGLKAIKDKRTGPGWSFEEVCRGPTGLR